MTLSSALEATERRGMLLVFPLSKTGPSLQIALVGILSS